MEKLHDAGKARAIGVSNFASKKLGDLLALARIPPAVDQVECHPGWQQTKLHSFCQSKGVHLSVSLLSNYIFLPVNVLASGACAFSFWKTWRVCACAYQSASAFCRRTHH
jgi:predicted oxidoreductase